MNNDEKKIYCCAAMFAEYCSSEYYAKAGNLHYWCGHELVLNEYCEQPTPEDAV
jgi:hypothetical protein